MISPSGHRNVVRQAGLVGKQSDLELVLQEILNLDFFTYESYLKVLSGLDPDPREAQLLVQRYSSEISPTIAKYFLNSVYNLSRKKYIHHSIPTDPIFKLGFDLPSDKFLYVSVPSSNDLGWESNGVIVSSASTGAWAGLGLKRSGVVVQAASSGAAFGSQSDCLCIALEEPVNYGKSNSGRIIHHDKVSDDLRGYCNYLVSVCDSGEDAVISEFGETPAGTVRETLYGLVGWRPRRRLE